MYEQESGHMNWSLGMMIGNQGLNMSKICMAQWGAVL
jgi:hypothetical protein